MEKLSISQLSREYDSNFVPDKHYLDGMPDLQHSDFQDVPIDFVGIEGMPLPIKIREKSGEIQEVQAMFTGTVNTDSQRRGIDMSRIYRSLFKSKDDIFDINKLEDVLRNYQKDLKSFDTHILMHFNYRVWMPALRSKKDDGTPEGGWKYVPVTFDCNLDKNGEFVKIMHIDFVYSSTCPCSTELSMYAAETRGCYGAPHSQRSIARCSMMFNDIIWIEDALDILKTALVTPTQVFVKRIDEMAFGELCATPSYPGHPGGTKFVEDAIRNIANEFNKHSDILDYKVICSHRESLHDWNAIAVITKGLDNSIFNHHVTYDEWQSLIV